jgi:hypothetical protein
MAEDSRRIAGIPPGGLKLCYSPAPDLGGLAMDLPRLSPTVRRITILSRDESGAVVPVVVFNRSRNKKKGMRGLRSAERLTRNLAEASSVATSRYLSGHRKSNRKRRDGWIRDLNLNLVQSGRKGWTKVDPLRVFGS